MIQPLLIPGKASATANNKMVSEAAANVLIDCVMLNNMGGSARQIVRLSIYASSLTKAALANQRLWTVTIIWRLLWHYGIPDLSAVMESCRSPMLKLPARTYWIRCLSMIRRDRLGVKPWAV